MDFTLTYVNSSGDSIDGFPEYERLENTFTFEDGTPWTDVMDKFVRFLGACYGYDISEQVKYESYYDRYNKLVEDYPEIQEDLEEDPRDSQGREFN